MARKGHLEAAVFAAPDTHGPGDHATDRCSLQVDDLGPHRSNRGRSIGNVGGFEVLRVEDVVAECRGRREVREKND